MRVDPLPVMYLLAGNGGAADWWLEALPCFERHHAVPLELPGFGDNAQAPLDSLEAYARALLDATSRGSAIFAVGVNALVVLHALRLAPGHFSRTVLLAPVGAYLWRRRLPALMSLSLPRRCAHWVLSNRPQWLANSFTRQRWSRAQYERVASGYRRCRAFLPYWDQVRADNALELLEWVTDPIELVWGGQDAVLGSSQAAAWSAVLARADLRVSIRPTWGHYPWIDAPHEFVEWLEKGEPGFVAHGKAGRTRLAGMAGLPVPESLTVTAETLVSCLEQLPRVGADLWAVRSSSRSEDQADLANAGLSTTHLRVPTAEVAGHARELIDAGVEEVLVQPFVTARVSGIAFVRRMSAEIEWVDGHLEGLADGRVEPRRAVLSTVGAAWRVGRFEAAHGLTEKALWHFLQEVLHVFHYVHGDIEWAWDGRRLWLLQYRPVTGYGWRRHLSSANIAEILPSQPSRLIEYAQRRAATSAAAVQARWDPAVLELNEPFLSTFEDATYFNNDAFISRLSAWGVSSRRFADEVGGTVPRLGWRPWRLLLALPIFVRMLFRSRAALKPLGARLRDFDDELERLRTERASGAQLAEWLVRFEVFLLQGALCIGAAVTSSGGAWLGRPVTVYRDLDASSPHRLPWETDPATPRPVVEVPVLQEFPVWPRPIEWAHALGLPGMRGYYLQVREWYRDNLMRIFFRLHHAMPAHERAHWFEPNPSPRTRSGGFWQDGASDGETVRGFLIYPGEVHGVLGEDILFEDALDPGRHAAYRQARAVVSRIGGRLSHGATLLREMRRPSAVVPDADPAWLGRRVRFSDGKLSLLDGEA